MEGILERNSSATEVDNDSREYAMKAATKDSNNAALPRKQTTTKFSKLFYFHN